MTKVKAEITNAVVGQKRHGELIELNKETAEKLEAKGYVRITGTAPESKQGATQTAKPRTKGSSANPAKKATKDKPSTAPSPKANTTAANKKQ